ncbi:MAG: hypothetical protein FIB07_17920 [Candidatus Methanoperedens sp.]|nr:hypothetical protein [Candidatus Methanoperedens sp.]
MTRKKLIIGIIILIAVVLIIKENINPYFMMGIPVGVFGINNMDSTNHSVNVQVFDSNNTLLINETYKLGYSQSGQSVPGQSINYPENGWKSVHDKERLFPNGYYTFIIKLDNNAAQPFKKYLDTWSQVSIAIDNYGNLSVGEVVV